MVDKADPSGCWMWLGGTGSGYGVITLPGMATRGVHRISYIMAYGEIPQGMQVDHTCHQPLCVNPSHLRLATGKQNKENRKGAYGRSGIRGVSQHSNGRWRACVVHDRKYLHLGYFDTKEEAGEAARLKRLELFTHNDTDRRG